MSTFPSGTVTFLFTDIEGSTKLAREYPNTWEDLRARHHAILRSAIESRSGYVFQIIGDAFCAAFHTASDGLMAAVQAQLEIQDALGGNVLRVRMGIHTGPAELQPDGQYIGYLAMAHVQRLVSAGHGGQILISQAALDLIQDDLPQDVTLRDLGEHRLKDLARPEHIFQAAYPGLQADFPAIKSLSNQLNNLPVQPTPFLGREHEIAAVTNLLRSPDTRLFTLTGPGGSGKTRLSIRVAADILDEFEHGAWFVDLSPISDPALVLPTLAATFQVRESSGISLEQALQIFLQPRSLLLVIDNFEQVVSAAPVIGRLLAGAPRLKILVSSREVLRLRWEHDYPVPPLGLPQTRRRQTPAVLAQYEAIALFLERARAANPAFELDENNAAAVVEICTRLDGLPLAIELAAARSRLLKPEAMLEKLKNRFNLLTGGARDLPGRQQTIRAAIDWSYDLLDEDEKKLFTRLGVFVGGWTIAGAEAVCAAGLDLDIVGGLESLLDKSLVRQVDGRSGSTRFSMLETIREYALEKLSMSGKLDAIRQAHVDMLAAALKSAAEAVATPGEAAAFAVLDDELDNLRSAMGWSLSTGRPILGLAAGHLYQYWMQRILQREVLAWLQKTLEVAAEAALLEKAHAQNCAGNLATDTGDHQSAEKFYQSALESFRQAGDRDGISRALNNLGNMAKDRNEIEKSRLLYQESLDYQPPAAFGVALTLLNLGELARINEDWANARNYFMRAREICENLGADAGISYADSFLCKMSIILRDVPGALKWYDSCLASKRFQSSALMQAVARGWLGYIRYLQGEMDQARSLIAAGCAAESEILEMGVNSEIWYLAAAKARLAVMDGNFEYAAQMLAVEQIIRKKEQYSLAVEEKPDYEAAVARAISALGQAAFDENYAKGLNLAYRSAKTFALEQAL
jgi:predicted ATPase/class 3 adenylate cyclase